MADVSSILMNRLTRRQPSVRHPRGVHAHRFRDPRKPLDVAGDSNVTYISKSLLPEWPESLSLKPQNGVNQRATLEAQRTVSGAMCAQIEEFRNSAYVHE